MVMARYNKLIHGKLSTSRHRKENCFYLQLHNKALSLLI